jgi:DNA-binding transcriptional regulator GbsR (MarR family)
MKEYLVDIEIEDKDNSHEFIFRSSTLTVLFLAMDDFRKAITNVYGSDTSLITDTKSMLKSISNNFERQLTTVDEQDQVNEEEKALPTTNKDNEDDDDEQQDDNPSTLRGRNEPALKISFPGAQ